ncbi:tyrosine-type recombinase/integrase [Methylobacterium komagatae]
MAGKETFTRERVRLTQAHVKQAQGLIARDALQGTGVEFADTVCQGLVLRVRRRSGKFILKSRTGSTTLGDMDTLPVAAARVAATKVRAELLKGTPKRLIDVELNAFGYVFEKGHNLEAALDVAFTEAHPDDPVEMSDEDRRRYGPWFWSDLVELHLAAKMPKLKPRWAVQFERHLRRSLTPDIRFRPVSGVTVDHLIELRNDIMRERTPSAAADTIEAVKGALDWAWSLHAPTAGLAEVQHPWWRERLKVDWASTPRERTPTLEELARTLVLADTHKALGGTGKQTAPGMLAALWAVVLTAQRAGALTGTLRATTRPWPERPGWEIWTWTKSEMKGGKPHAIPVPPEALAEIRRHRVDPASPFLFPSRVPGKPVTAVGLTQLFDRMRGKAKAGKAGGVTLRPEDDLFAAHGIEPWTPHDVRRTLGAFLDVERLGGAASAILAHKPPSAKGDPGQERELAQAITLKHYVHSQRLDLKAEGMAAWVTAVLEAVDQERARLGA